MKSPPKWPLGSIYLTSHNLIGPYRYSLFHQTHRHMGDRVWCWNSLVSWSLVLVFRWCRLIRMSLLLTPLPWGLKRRKMAFLQLSHLGPQSRGNWLRVDKLFSKMGRRLLSIQTQSNTRYSGQILLHSSTSNEELWFYSLLPVAFPLRFSPFECVRPWTHPFSQVSMSHSTFLWICSLEVLIAFALILRVPVSPRRTLSWHLRKQHQSR